MTRLLAVAFPYETTASAAAGDVRSLALDVVLAADSVAVITRDAADTFHLTTNHKPAAGRPMRGAFWFHLVSLLFFGSAGTASGVSSMPCGLRDMQIDARFIDRVSELLGPGTSALFLAADSAVPAGALQNLIELGGVVVTTPLSAEAGWESGSTPPTTFGTAATSDPHYQKAGGTGGRDDADTQV